jgi:hypothetical protein
MHNKTIMLCDADGDEREVEVPHSWHICHRCSGEGTHTNPSIDGNGITESEWSEWSPEEREGYFAGDYDVPCEDCGGSGKVEEVETEAFQRRAPADYADWCKQSSDDEEYEQMVDSEAKWERRMLYGSDG